MSKYTQHHVTTYLEGSETYCDYCHTSWYDPDQAPCDISINVAHMNGHCLESPDGKHEFGVGGYLYTWEHWLHWDDEICGGEIAGVVCEMCGAQSMPVDMDIRFVHMDPDGHKTRIVEHLNAPCPNARPGEPQHWFIGAL